jgi:hypothetical protein
MFLLAPTSARNRVFSQKREDVTPLNIKLDVISYDCEITICITSVREKKNT